MVLRSIPCTAVLLALILACAHEPTDGDLDEGPPIQLGTPIRAEDVSPDVTRLLWARDGAEIYYYAPAPAYHSSTLKAVRVADGAVRIIDPRVRFRSDLRYSRQGHAVLDFSADAVDDLSFDIERIAVDGSGVQRLARDVQYAIRRGWPAAFAEHDTFYVFTRQGGRCPLRPGPAQGSFSYCDTLYVQTAPDAEPAALGPGDLLTLSPDGSQVLFLAEPCDKVGPVRDCPGMIHRLTDGATLSAGFTEWSEDISPQYRWDTRGLRRLCMHYSPDQLLFIEDLVTHDTTLVHRFDRRGEDMAPLYVADYAWSDDGGRVALWAYNALWGKSLYLYVIDIGSAPRPVAAVTYGMEPGDIALSPDGRTVAYVVGNRIYLQAVEP